ncbi:O-acetylhomoserine aminocarboxypropyltransferase/cysteine synthase family protein [Microbacterium radiodurans]|uniref:homocysteine desulfhydrase n=1 Tax=Microbacterium radiodurans TaxID=661398 RepID=A0A5J5IV42_9MICO|nr:aminotransferase class I/II-fold pyridoxal phosphate-dependent enzyme [Microbacterium radiodurans]KAA9089737.1 O-acetylhomoserine aminocarboxypropyltransferase/cysteine synthase [Microbacterium radiodurans]
MPGLESSPAPLAFATRQLHAGARGFDSHGARATPIYLTAGFEFDDLADGESRFADPDTGFSYTRVGNPTAAAAERRIADLEGGVGALLVGSGQAATSTALLTILEAGDHIVAASAIYEGTRELLRSDLGRLGITTDFVDDPRDPAAWEAAIGPDTRALVAESIANPRGGVLDIPVVAEIAHRHGIPLIVDSTLATPYLLRPLELGADIVVHSASKFLSGHGTALGGIIVDAGRFAWDAVPGRFRQIAGETGPDGRTFVERSGERAFLDAARRVAMRFGPSPSPLNAFLLLQGVETLSLRVERQSQTAATLASWLEARPEVASVDYSGLASHPDHDLAERLLPAGRGALFAFTLAGGRAAAEALTTAVRLFTPMTHLGDVRSLVLHPATTTHAHRSDADLELIGVGPGLLRLSVGLEDAADLVADLERGLAAAAATTTAAAVTPVAAPLEAVSA